MSARPGWRRGTHGPGGPGRASPRATASSIARTGRACDGRRATCRRIFRSSAISGLGSDLLYGVHRRAGLLSGSARERRFSEFSLGHHDLARFAGVVVVFSGLCFGRGGTSRYFRVPRCLTIISEGRETWTAGSLRLAFWGRHGVERRCERTAPTVTFSDSSRRFPVLAGGDGCVWDSSRRSG